MTTQEPADSSETNNMDEENTAPVFDATSSQAGDEKPVAEPDSPRRSSWKASVDGWDRLVAATFNREMKLRESDRTTGMLLILSVLAIISLFPFPSARGFILIVLDLLFLFIIMLYLSNRLGLITAFSERQTAIFGQIILGFVSLAVIMTLNVCAFIGLAANSIMR